MAIQDLTPQLRTRLDRVEKAVGVFVLLAILALVVGFAYYLYHTAERKGWFIPKCSYYTFVENGEGLQVGDPVVLMGFEVGKITVITAQPPGSYYKVYLGMEIRRPYYGYIWSDSKARIGAAGLLGSRQVGITAGSTGVPTVYEDGGKITGLLVGGHRVSVTDASKGVYLPADEEPALADRVQQLTATLEQGLPGVLSLTNQLSAVLSNTAELTANVNQIATNMAVATANLRNPNGSLGEWLIPSETQTNLNANLVSLNNALLSLAAITSNLNTQVQTNNTVLTRVSTLVADTDNLVQGLKKHWLLRGVFLKMNNQTNAVPGKVQPAGATEQGK
jgi:hypothetical protein